MPVKNNQKVTGIQKYFMLGVLLILIVVLLMFLSPFVADLLIAAIIVTAVYPVHKLLNKKITLDLAIQLCSNISFLTFEEFTNLVLKRELLPAIQLIFKLNEKGYSVMDILDNYFIFIKTTTILTEDQKYKIIPYLCKYITIFHNIHEDEIELALFTNNLIKILSE